VVSGSLGIDESKKIKKKKKIMAVFFNLFITKMGGSDYPSPSYANDYSTLPN
jgi:hypothetical protein